mmetsp:Transcript_8496/g.24359  ORF Transcript_8496/g.24359 Transcript_8496/m.24359 type:complete len:341 (+) Transcript_8496:169-1191(+)
MWAAGQALQYFRAAVVALLMLPFLVAVFLLHIPCVLELIRWRDPGSSMTAVVTLWYRALLSRKGDRDDPGAEALFFQGRISGISKFGWAWWLIARVFMLFQQLSGIPVPGVHFPKLPRGKVKDMVAMRVQFFDEAIAWLFTAKRNISQAVSLGAGFDTYAYGRMQQLSPGSEVAFFEVDRPATQAAKRGALKAAGINSSRVQFVPCDLQRSDWLEDLQRCGFDLSSPAYVHWEGVSMYLSKDAIASTLQTFAQLAPGSMLAFDYLDLSKFPAGYIKKMESLGEPWTFGIEGGESVDTSRIAVSRLLAKHGLKLARHVCFEDSGGPGVGRFWGGCALAEIM